jgi:hypothetical protein
MRDHPVVGTLPRPARACVMGSCASTTTSNSPQDGSIAQFWRLRPAATPRSAPADEFRDFDVPGYAKAATSFWFVPDPAGTMCHTETRVTTTDVPSRRKMSAYWLLIRPGSGLIRRAILHEIARRAAIDQPS